MLTDSMMFYKMEPVDFVMVMVDKQGQWFMEHDKLCQLEFGAEQSVPNNKSLNYW